MAAADAVAAAESQAVRAAREPEVMNPTIEERNLLSHFLAAIAYRTQKALRGARPNFSQFRAGPETRTPHELVNHMTSVLGYATTFFVGGAYRPELFPDFSAEIARLHDTLTQLKSHILDSGKWATISVQQLLQGPLADAMTHAGQLAMLRRLSGDPVPPENFIFAAVSSDNLGPDQAQPVAPDAVWPEAP